MVQGLSVKELAGDSLALEKGSLLAGDDVNVIKKKRWMLHVSERLSATGLSSDVFRFFCCDATRKVPLYT